MPLPRRTTFSSETISYFISTYIIDAASMNIVTTLKRLRFVGIISLVVLSSAFVSHAQSVAERIDTTIVRAMRANNIPGLSVAIVKDGTLAFAKGYGLADRERNIPVTTQTRFAIASVSKTFTAIALMQLVQAGQVRLDADVNTYLPFQVRNPAFPMMPITVQMVLTHTSSINDGPNLFSDFVVSGDSPIALADFMRRSLSSNGDLLGRAAEFSMRAPGAEFRYTNMNTALLGYIVEVVARQPFNQYCNQRLFAPLCMNATRWLLSELDSTTVAVPYSKNGTNLVRRPYTGFPDYPDGQIRTNVLDMSKFLWALLNNGSAFSGSQILSPATLRQILSPVAPSGSIGLHFFYDEITSRDSAWGHAGGLDDATAEMYFLRSENVGVTFMANTSVSSANSTALWQALMALGREIVPNTRNPIVCDLVSSVRTEKSNQSELVTLSPNPVNDVLLVNLPTNGVSVRLVDVLGRDIYSLKDAPVQVQISTEHLAQGAYFLVVSRNGSVIATEKILKY